MCFHIRLDIFEHINFTMIYVLSFGLVLALASPKPLTNIPATLRPCRPGSPAGGPSDKQIYAGQIVEVDHYLLTGQNKSLSFALQGRATCWRTTSATAACGACAGASPTPGASTRVCGPQWTYMTSIWALFMRAWSHTHAPTSIVHIRPWGNYASMRPVIDAFDAAHERTCALDPCILGGGGGGVSTFFCAWPVNY